MVKKVFVSGCFDLLHSGHIAFFQQAAQYGDLYVALGSDATVYQLKGRLPVVSEDERLYSIKAIRYVTDAFISRGSGLLDFEAEFRELKPDIFLVNADGNTPEKDALCREVGVEYVVLERTPFPGLPARSTTSLRRVDQMPYRIDLAGGWLDQPFVSSLHPGSVLTISLEPTIAFNERSGMATSTRNRAIELWGLRLPPGDPEQIAKVLFSYDNPPGTRAVSGSQDAIGIVYPGLARAHYTGSYWPDCIDHLTDNATLQFIENALWLIPLKMRPDGYDPLGVQHLTPANAQALADAADACWEAILARDIRAFGAAVRASFQAQVALFPNSVDEEISRFIDEHRGDALGWKLSGAGGGGYLILVSDQPIKQAFRISIRRTLE
ncbi:MAG: adenylyltransferase/cytidyltransferase family protein [Chloroflexi bacterium]|nr:adenylyltransferase/cytidyltransferase family protein [Chloroflexota bacterium]